MINYYFFNFRSCERNVGIMYVIACVVQDMFADNVLKHASPLDHQLSAMYSSIRTTLSHVQSSRAVAHQ